MATKKGFALSTDELLTYADGTTEGKAARLARLLPLLACSHCQGSLVQHANVLQCQACSAQHAIKSGVPVILPKGVQDPGAAVLSEEDRVSRHPYGQRAEEIIQQHADGLVLDLGAGGKLDRRRNVVQIDIFRYPAVDVVSSADCLPFADNTFDAVISQAVFEHLQYPELAVREIRRVLKPGGLVKVDTAFLQPEHGYPYHFYNATETGLLHWFRDFDIQWSGVEPHQHPKWALHWFLGVYLNYVGKKQELVLRSMPVGDLVDVLQRHSSQETTAAEQSAVLALDSIPDHLLKVLAAGVSVHALNPAKSAVKFDAVTLSSASALDRERELAQLRVEKAQLASELKALRESEKTAKDKAEYLAQFYPSSSNLAQFAAAWADPMHLHHIEGNAAEREHDGSSELFASLVVRPTDISALLDTFFSLNNQVFSGWELVLFLDAGAQAGVQRAALALARLDKRVRVFQKQDVLRLRGEYVLHLPQGATLAADALREVITVARNLSGVRRIGFDFDFASDSGDCPMRCHSLGWSAWTDCIMDAHTFAPWFERVSPNEGGRYSESDVAVAHIPKVLIHIHPVPAADVAAQKASFVYLLEQCREVSDELAQINGESPTAARELRQLNQDVANYLSQFYFDTRPADASVSMVQRTKSALGRFARKNLPLWILKGLVAGRSIFNVKGASVHAGAAAPLVTAVLEPMDARALICTFFSLVHQTYSGWELLLIEDPQQSEAVRRAMFDFARLDARVKLVDGKKPQGQGSYRLQLVDGVAFSFDAVECVATLVQSMPGVEAIVCDYDCITQQKQVPIRCMNAMVSPVVRGQCFSGTFELLSLNDEGCTNDLRRDHQIAHIARSLFHIALGKQLQ